MAVSMRRMALLVGSLGVISFILGVVAENKKPAAGTGILGKGGVLICKYPSDFTAVLGFLSSAFLLASSFAGHVSLFYGYKGKPVPKSAFYKSTSFSVFYTIALGTSGLALAFLLWPSFTEQFHLSRNVHHNINAQCATAKTGLLGGGAFLSLDASLFWLVALMLADNAREDYFDEVEGRKSELADDYDAPAHLKSPA